MRILYAGSPGVATPTLQALHDAGHEIVGVLSQPPKPYGRKKELHPTPVSDVATLLGLPVFTPDTPEKILEVVNYLQPDIAIVVAYGKILRQEVLDAVPLGWWNIHFSLLPRWRGASPVMHALAHGDRKTGVSLFRIVPELDAGPVVLKFEVDIHADETHGALLDRLSLIPPVIVLRFVGRMGLSPLPEYPQEGPVTYAPKLKSGAGALDLSQDLGVVYRAFRAHTPEPGAYVVRADNNRRVKILGAWAEASKEHVEPGLVLRKPTGIVLGTNTAPLILQRVHPVGKDPMQADDWFRGLPPDTRMHVGSS
jgi:methionyl-tRNA formyltransferase